MKRALVGDEGSVCCGDGLWCVIRPEVSREDRGEVYRQSSDAESCMPYKVNQERRQRIPKARYCVKNCRAYDAALRRRGDLPSPRQ